MAQANGKQAAKKRPGSAVKRAGYHHGALREALLDATEALLREDGLEAFTLRECARRAGVSHGAPAHHFGDARGLLSEFSAVSFEQLDAAMRAHRARSADEPFAQFLATGCAYVEYATRNVARFQLMFRSDRLDFANERLAAAGRAVFGQLEETVAALGPSLDDTGRRIRVAAAWSMAHGVATLAIDNRMFAQLAGNASPPAFMHTLIELFRPMFAPSPARARQR